MAFAWKFLLPLSAINLIAIAVEIVLWPSPGSTELWIIGLANFAIAGIAIFALATALGHRNFSAREPQRPIRNIVSEKVI
jgi:hypothetical protein